MRLRILRSRVGVALLTSLACIHPVVAQTADPKAPALSPLVQRILTWLPEDTESVVAGQAFTMPAGATREGDPGLSFTDVEILSEIMAARSLGVLTHLDAKCLRPLAGRKITLALCGNRNFDWVSGTLPTHRSESCTVVVFDKEFGEAEKQLIDLLRAGGEATRKIAGRDVFVFPASRHMRPSRAWTWRGRLGIFLAVLDSRTLLCATSDTYLEIVLNQVDKKPDRRAIPENLAVWKQIDPRAAAWMVWHPGAVVEKFGGEPLIDGITSTVTRDELRAVFLSEGPIAERMERTARKLFNSPDLDPPATVERLKDGKVVASCSTKNLAALAKFSLAFTLYHLEAANCPLDEE